MFRRDFCKLGVVGLGGMLIKPSLCSADGPIKRWAVVYSTWCGSTKEVATAIAKGIGEEAEIIDVKDKPVISNYEHFIVGGAIRAGKTSTELQNFIKNNQNELAKRVRGLYVVCGNGGNPNVDQNSTYITSLKSENLWGKSAINVKTKVFPGRFDKNYCASDDTQAKSLSMNPYDNLSVALPMAEDFGKSLLATNVKGGRLLKGHNNGFELFQNEPNPFTRVTTIRYYIAEPSYVQLNIYAMSGKKVAGVVS